MIPKCREDVAYNSPLRLEFPGYVAMKIFLDWDNQYHIELDGLFSETVWAPPEDVHRRTWSLANLPQMYLCLTGPAWLKIFLIRSMLMDKKPISKIEVSKCRVSVAHVSIGFLDATPWLVQTDPVG